MDSCATCRHSMPTVCDDKTDLVLCCRRFPPQVFVSGEDVCCAWPQVDESDCCGEWTSSDAPRQTLWQRMPTLLGFRT